MGTLRPSNRSNYLTSRGIDVLHQMRTWSSGIASRFGPRLTASRAALQRFWVTSSLPLSTLIRIPRWMGLGTRVGIAGRLTIAFGAVAVLAVAANLVAEHGPSMIGIPEVPILAALPAPSIRPQSPPLAHAKISNAPLRVAIDRFGRAVLGRVDEDSPPHAVEMNVATKMLQDETVAFNASAAGAVDHTRLSRLTAQVSIHQQQAKELIRIADARRRLRRNTRKASRHSIRR